MPVDPITGAAIISGGASLISSALGSASSGNMNKKNRKFTAEQNALNRKMSWDMWNSTNAYNTPLAQMARFKEAGLNPHLIYGQTNEAPLLKPPDQKTHQDEYVPPPDFGAAAMAYVSTKKQQAEIDNLKVQNGVLETQGQLNRANAVKAIADSDLTQSQKDRLLELLPLETATMQANLQTTGIQQSKMRQEIENLVATQNNTIAATAESRARAQKVAQDITESAERIKILKIEGRIKEAEYEMKSIEKQWMQLGTTKNDPSWQRKLIQILGDLTVWRDTKGRNIPLKDIAK